MTKVASMPKLGQNCITLFTPEAKNQRPWIWYIAILEEGSVWLNSVPRLMDLDLFYDKVECVSECINMGE